MDIQEYIKKIQYLKETLPERLNDSVFPEIAKKATESFKNRIFKKGLDSDENEIGQYSTKPIHVTEKQFVKKSAFVPTSKKGKSMTLKNGYKELKQVQGLKNDSVNLLYSGDLKKSVSYTNTNDGFIIGFTNIENTDKAKELEKKYGKSIFRLSENEKENIKKQILLATRNTFL